MNRSELSVELEQLAAQAAEVKVGLDGIARELSSLRAALTAPPAGMLQSSEEKAAGMLQRSEEKSDPAAPLTVEIDAEPDAP